MESLAQLRKKIDELDDELVRILCSRAQVVDAIADWKRERGEQAYAPDREREILERVAQLNSGPLLDTEIQEMMALLIRGFRRFLERRLK